MSEPKYPQITVQLTRCDGNAFAILGEVQRALKRGEVPAEKVKEFMAEAMAGDYDQLLRTCMAWVNVE